MKTGFLKNFVNGSAVNELNCPHCKAMIAASVKFCPECGKNPAAPVRLPLTITGVMIIIAVGAALFSFSWFTQKSVAGTKPTKSHAEISGQQTAAHSADMPAMTMDQIQIKSEKLEPLRAETRAKPESIAAWRALGSAVLAEVKTAKPADRQKLMVEYVQILSKIRTLDPKDKDTLLILADLAFQRGVFDKAAELYETYLELDAENRAVSAKLASAYTFIGRYEDSVQLLKELLKEDPESFQAHAYLSITYAQMGDTERAIAQGEIALIHAPNPEATRRFGAFLDKLTTKNLPENARKNEGLKTE